MGCIKNKYKLPVTAHLLDSYINLLINEIYKLLPVFEGKNKDKEIVFSKGQAYYHFLVDLDAIILEVNGDFSIFINNEKYLQLLIILEGMQDIKVQEHDKVKNIVFKCIQLCNDIKKSIKE